MSDEVKLREDEAKLREDAARRLERRRRKMQSSEDRLSKITGQPVSASSAGTSIVDTGLPDDPPSPTVPSANGTLAPLYDPIPDSLAYDSVPDPPLEDLERDPFTQNNDLDAGRLDMNMFNNLMMGNSAGTPGVKPEVKVYTMLWVILAVLTRLLLHSPYSHIVGDNIVVPFLLLLTGLIITRVVDVRNLQSSSLITAALVLCGVKPERVALLTQFLHAARLLFYCFSIYLFSFITVHLVLEAYVEA